jgi:DtxR family Mn-dependent transcriptional regulator
MDSPAARRQRGLKPLEEALPGERLLVVSLFERDRKLLEYLDGAGIRPGVRLEVVAVNGGLDLRSGLAYIHLEKAVGPKVWVKVDGD